MTATRLGQLLRFGVLWLSVSVWLPTPTAAGESMSPKAPTPALGSTQAPPPPVGESESDCALGVAERVQAYYNRIADFEAEFEQVTRSVALGRGEVGNEVARGKVVMAKPGKMRWEYSEPRESLVLSDGENLWLYDVAAGEAQHMVASGGYLSGAALQFLMGRGVIADDFVVTSPSCSSESAVVELTLEPRAYASYERLGLRVVRSTGEVKATTLVDLFGSVTTISFHSARINQAPPEGTFRFDLPPGVELIELQPPQ